jgi:hypothetical protein
MEIPGRSWPLPAEGWPAVSFLHNIREMVVRNKAKTVQQEEPLKGRRSGRNIGRNPNATSE